MSLELIPSTIGAISSMPTSYFNQLPSWFLQLAIPITITITIMNVTFNTAIAGYFLKKKIRKKAPDLEILTLHLN